jgi:hypothetical protein
MYLLKLAEERSLAPDLLRREFGLYMIKENI